MRERRSKTYHKIVEVNSWKCREISVELELVIWDVGQDEYKFWFNINSAQTILLEIKSIFDRVNISWCLPVSLNSCSLIFDIFFLLFRYRKETILFVSLVLLIFKQISNQASTLSPKW